MSKWKTGKYVFNMVFPKPKPTKGESFQVFGQKTRGKFKKSMEKSNEDLDKVLTQSQKLLQKVKGEKITESGISKGKDIK
jgi:hypothetical protein